MVATAIALERKEEEEVLTGVIAERVLAVAPVVPVVFSHPVDLLSRSSPAETLSLF